MIVDSSAVVALIQREADAVVFSRALLGSDRPRMSAATYLETGIVVDRSADPVASRRLDELLRTFGVVIESVTEVHARLARGAYRDFGRGSGHPARLNFGDCFSYALAKDADEPLLFKGDVFVHTDVRPALTR